MRSVALWLIAGSCTIAPASCAEATAIDVYVESEVSCDKGADVFLTVGASLADLPTNAPTGRATTCEDAGDGLFRRGHIVVVPISSRSEDIAFQLTTRNDKQPVPDTCLQGKGAEGCIKEFRQLRFSPHKTIRLDVTLRLSCISVDCPVGLTCDPQNAQCVPTPACQDASQCSPLNIGPTSIRPVIGTLAISKSGRFDCAVKGGALKCWGENTNGQLGDNTMTDQSVPTDVSGLSSGVVAVTAGTTHACALLGSGGVMCWGDNTSGLLGVGDTGPHLVPAALPALTAGVSGLTAGYQFTCAALASGSASCWGDNTKGTLGIGAAGPVQSSPMAVSGLSTGVAGLSSSYQAACARLDTGNVMCWGANVRGELGVGDTLMRPSPTPIPTLPPKVTVMGGGTWDTCAVTAGELRCWGDNGLAQVDPTTNERDSPVVITSLGPNVVGVAIGPEHVCALMLWGGIRCWGGGAYGQLGNGVDNKDSPIPRDVIGLASKAVAVAAGERHTCALLDTGAIQCWGSDTHGQLGYGGMGDSLRPVSVVGFP